MDWFVDFCASGGMVLVVFLIVATGVLIGWVF